MHAECNRTWSDRAICKKICFPPVLHVGSDGKPSPQITIFIGGLNHSQMGGLWLLNLHIGNHHSLFCIIAGVAGIPCVAGVAGGWFYHGQPAWAWDPERAIFGRNGWRSVDFLDCSLIEGSLEVKLPTISKFRVWMLPLPPVLASTCQCQALLLSGAVLWFDRLSHWQPSAINWQLLVLKLTSIWRDEKAVSREKSQKRKDQKKEDAGAQKDRKIAKYCVFFVVLWLRRVEK